MTPRRKLPFLLILAGILLFGCLAETTEVPVTVQPPSGKSMQVVMLDVGQGDAILIISPSGKTMLVDGGNSSQDGQDVILAYLQTHGFDRLDVMVLTHPDADHVGGLPTVLRGIPVGAVVSTGQVHTTQIYAEFLQELKTARDEHGTKIIRGVAGASVPFDDAVQVQVLGPSEAAIEGEDLNNASVVLRLTYGQISVLLTGDAEMDEENWIIAQGGDLSAQILKVSHHGSKTGSNDALLNAIDAQIGLISCAADNRYGHPHAEALERLARHKVKVYRTDELGAIKVTTDGMGYQVTSSK